MQVSKNPVVPVNDIVIPTDAVLRRLGYPSRTTELTGEVVPLFEAMVERAPALIEAKGVYRIFNIAVRNEDRIDLVGTYFPIESRQVVRMLRAADRVVLFMVTIGPLLENEVKRLFDADQMAEAVILDAIGSETADAVADRFHREELRLLAQEANMNITPRFSPGYGDWPVSVQGAFMEACGGASIGISVNTSSLMTPRKSVSAVIGWEKSKTNG